MLYNDAEDGSLVQVLRGVLCSNSTKTGVGKKAAQFQKNFEIKDD